ncbi:MAG: asparagine synthase-related protein [Candidatus Latescibacterota bacterium]
MRPERLSIDLRNPYCDWNATQVEESPGTRAVRVWTRGQAWEKQTYLEGHDLSVWLSRELSNESKNAKSLFDNLLQKLNGTFALIAEMHEGVLAATDRLRSIPLFYGLRGSAFLLSDDAHQVKDFVGNTDFEELSAKEFLLTGYVTGSDTLFPDVKQIQAGERISVERTGTKKVATFRYYRFLHANYFEEPEEQLYGLMEEMLTRVFERLVRSVQGRRIVVPLSGGLDSRLIVVMLKRLGVENVVCFSYGRPGNRESEISREVAGRLGYVWCFVPYTRACWRKWFQSEEGRAYLRYGSGMASYPIFQDWPAIWEMKERNELQDGDVIVPGHSADFLAGSHIPPHYQHADSLAGADVVSAILEKHYVLWKWRTGCGDWAQLLSLRVADRMEDDTIRENPDAVDVFETWDWQERQAKFIVNCCKGYEFWGYDWRIPFWDNEMMDFWARVPLSMRIGKKLYSSCLETRLFAEFGVGGLYPGKPFAGNKPLCRKPNSPSRALLNKWRTGWEMIGNPHLGRYRFCDYVRMWGAYHQRFGNSRRSISRFLSVNTLGASVCLQAWNQSECTRSVSLANRFSHEAPCFPSRV